MKINGHYRTFKLILPDQTAEDIPLVFYTHGYGGGNLNKSTILDQFAETNKFALCIPQGLKDPKGKRSWNVGYPFQKGFKVNDIKDLCKLASILQKKYHLSKKNTFFSGISNGGELCYLLAYSKQKTFKAFASISGLTLLWVYQKLTPQKIPFFAIHGTEDRTSEWTGDLHNLGGWGAYLPVNIAIGNLVANNRCLEERQETIPSIDPKSNHRIIKHIYSHDNTSTDEVWLYEVIGGHHGTLSSDIHTGEEIWSFFKRHLKK